jgi:hypothetical protein
MYLQTKDVAPEKLEDVHVDIKAIEEQIRKSASKQDISCLNPQHYEFDFVPMGKSTLRKDTRVKFQVV